MNARQFVRMGLLFLLLSAAVGFFYTMDNPIRGLRHVAQNAHWEAQALRREGQQQQLALEFASSLTEFAAARDRPHRGAAYVPSYAHIRADYGRSPMNLATTLSIHNTSAEAPLVLDRIDYHNTQGDLIQSYLTEPVALRPFGTIEVFVPWGDVRGGGGANFVINWSSETSVPAPVIEAVMIGQSGTMGYSFVSKGRSIPSSAYY